MAEARHEKTLSANFWTERYDTERTGWDIGYTSTPLATYIDQLKNPELRILIPGCGNAYEAFYLWEKGFRKLTLLDISPRPVARLRAQFAEHFQEQPNILLEDFFEHQGTYDLILEQTFFCALPPSARPDYARKMAELLKPGGQLVGVLFNRHFTHQGPPFGGDPEAYAAHFAPYFEFKHWAECRHSIPPRRGSEWWINLVRK